MNKLFFILLTLIASFYTRLEGNEPENYLIYHQKIVEAEKLIFLAEKPLEGLKVFQQVFEQYDFVFVDDCVEAFQLALFYQQDALALSFLKKAIANGLKIRMLDHLICPNENANWSEKSNSTSLYKSSYVQIHKDFVQRYQTDLKKYEEQQFENFLPRINKKLLKKILEKHIREQAAKQCGKEMGNTKEKQQNIYQQVCDENLNFIAALFKQKIYVGERNLGILNYDVLERFEIPYLNENNRLQPSILQSLNLSVNTYVPVQTEANVFYINILYNILFHNKKSYSVLSNYQEEAINLGYLHPREYASLQYNHFQKDKLPEDNELYLREFTEELEDKVEKKVDKLRKKHHLPPYKVDYKKYQFSEQNCLQLCFGFRKASR